MAGEREEVEAKKTLSKVVSSGRGEREVSGDHDH